MCIIWLLSTTMWLRFQSFPLLYSCREGQADASVTSNSTIIKLTPAAMIDNFAEKGQRVSTKLELLRLRDIVCSLIFMKKYHLPFLHAGSSCKHSEKRGGSRKEDLGRTGEETGGQLSATIKSVYAYNSLLFTCCVHSTLGVQYS